MSSLLILHATKNKNKFDKIKVEGGAGEALSFVFSFSPLHIFTKGYS